MSDSILTFHETKNLTAMYRWIEETLERDPLKGTDAGFIRGVAAFFYGLVTTGVVEHKEILNRSQYGQTADLQEMLRVSTPADMEVTMRTRTGFYMNVSVMVATWEATTSAEQAVERFMSTLASDMQVVEVSDALREYVQKNLANARSDAVMMLTPHPGALLGMSHFDLPACNDMCYHLWGATGKPEYIERVIKAMDQKSGQTQEGMVPLTAAWSLGSLCQQYKSIDAVVCRVPGAMTKILSLNQVGE